MTTHMLYSKSSPPVTPSIMLMFTMMLATSADAAELSLQIRDSSGKAVSDAVVVLHGNGSDSAARPAGADIDQIDKEFVPYVSVIRTGTAVRFPNKDNIRHHVYSFSPAKKFELKLYSGIPAEPVVFDKPGIVTLGCNIHDWMLAHVLVTDSAWFARSNAKGELRISAPEGDYRLQIWHPDQVNAVPEVTLSLKAAETRTLNLDVRPRPAKAAGGY